MNRVYALAALIVLAGVAPAAAQYTPLPTGASGTTMRQEIDKRFNGVVGITPNLLAATPQQYGAVCNGSTDDSTAVNAALTAASTSTTHAVDATNCSFATAAQIAIPANVTLKIGTVTDNASNVTLFKLNSGSRLLGLGKGVSVVTVANGKITSSSGLGLVFNTAQTDHSMVIRGITFDGNRTNNSGSFIRAIELWGASDTLVDDVEVKNFAGAGVYLPESTRVTVTRSVFTDDGLSNEPVILGTSGAVETLDGVRISGNLINNSASSAEAIYFAATGGVTIQNLWEENNEIQLGSGNVMCIENFIGSGGSLITGVHIKGNKCAGSGGVAGAVAGNSNWGISLGGSGSAGQPLTNEVVDNEINYTSTAGIEDTWPNTLVADNVVSWSGFCDIDAQGATVPFMNSDFKGNIISNSVDSAHALLLIATTADVIGATISGNSITQPHALGIQVTNNSSTGKIIKGSILGNAIYGERSVTDGACSSVTNPTTFTSATASFTANDVTRYLRVTGAGAAGAILHTKITAVTNSTTVTMNNSCATTISAAVAEIGSGAGQSGIATNTGGIHALIGDNHIEDWGDSTDTSWGISINSGLIPGTNYYTNTPFSNSTGGPQTIISTDTYGYGYVASFGYGEIFSAAGQALGICNSAEIHQRACVSDSTACASGTTYASGGSTSCEVWCNGTVWKESGSGC